jgi:organic radical activating enzyme
MKIDIEKRLIYNCDAAKPQQVDIKWIEENPGQLFNTPVNVKEREMMLLNTRNTSCENNCFRAEDVGAISPRIIRKGYQKTHFDTITQPRTIDITLGSDCNLSCSYCTKEYSSTWRKDILDNGNYPVIIEDDRYQINSKDRIIHKLSQPNKNNTKHFKLILKEIESMTPQLEIALITGGESLLHNNLFDILDSLANVPQVILFSGLGISTSRFEKILSKLQKYKNIVLKLSCENIGPYLEFNRYGITWDQYKAKLDLIDKYKIDYIFYSTLSNLSLFGYHEFVEYFRETKKEYDFVYKPDFMSPYVMDSTSKNSIIKSFENDPQPWSKHIIKSLEADPSVLQIQNLKIFLKEFTKRRNISIIDTYPKHFVDWLDNVV